MKKVKTLGAPRRGVVWTASPSNSEFPDSSDCENTYQTGRDPGMSKGASAPASPRFKPSQRERRTSFAAFLQDHLAFFRHVVWG